MKEYNPKLQRQEVVWRRGYLEYKITWIREQEVYCYFTLEPGETFLMEVALNLLEEARARFPEYEDQHAECEKEAREFLREGCDNG